MATLTFNQDFDTFSSWNAQYSPSGTWRQDYGYGGINNYKLGTEAQIYTGPYFNGHAGDFNDGNYQLSNGVLSLVAHQTTNPEVLAMGYDYTSGLVTTRGLEPWLGGPTSQFSQEYGYFEMRADLSDEPGAWNAFWLLPAGGTSSGWNYAETDIVEMVGRENGMVWQATHGVADNGGYASVNVAGDGFHTFGLDWGPDTMTWYVDGIATRTVATPADMHQPMTIFANLAVGGSWAGAPDFGSDGQAAMKIDYIKVWDSNPYAAGASSASTTVVQSQPIAQAASAPASNTAISVSDAITHTEGDGGTSWYIYTVTRTGDLSKATTADYAVTGYGANPASASDFAGGAFPADKVWFGAGESVKQIWVPVSGDTTAEADEQFALSLSNPSGAQILNGVTYGTILNDDAGWVAPSAPASAPAASGAATSISLSPGVTQAEGSDGLSYQVYTVTRTGDLSGPTTAFYAVSGTGSTPASASDFDGGAFPANEVWFGGGESVKQIWIPVVGDTTPEADEHYVLTLSNATGADILNGAAYGTILNDDGWVV